MQPLDEASISHDRSTTFHSRHPSQSQPYDSQTHPFHHYQEQHHQEQDQQRQQRNLPHSVVLPPITHLERHSWPAQTINHSSRTPQSSSSSEQGQIVFTRQLWSRSMTNEPIDVLVSKHPSTLGAETSKNYRETVDARRPTSSSSRSIHRPPTSPESQTPLTPEESPPYRSTRKRTASIVEEEDQRSYGSAELSPSHGRASSGDSSAVQVCICQPDPKIPRPRNAFILYRQHHQANVIAEHPGLANPEISKIIGEQWRNQPADVKNEWKRLAEEEKLRHQQQYPSYRYQPKRNTRRNSLTDTPGSSTSERAKCPKCGGRTTLAPSFHGNYTSLNTSPSMVATGSLPSQTPTSATTPTSRTLPVLRELTLQSPRDPRRMVRPNPMAEISPRRMDERDDTMMSPDSKRRRFNNEQPVTMYRAMPPRYSVASPSSPYVITQSPHPHPYPPAQAQAQIITQHSMPGHSRRESLPSLRMVSPPGPMGPPPRPGMGYQQHRMSQGHVGPDRSLTLPPLKTGRSTITSPEKKSPGLKTSQDIMTSLSLSEKLEVLRRIAPPASVDDKHNRGPLLAIEGDSPGAVQKFAKWLVETLGKDEEMDTQLYDSPDVEEKGERSAMAAYHVLAAEWLDKTKNLLDMLSYDPKGKNVILASPSEMDVSPNATEAAVAEASKTAAEKDSRMDIDDTNAPQPSKDQAEPMQTDSTAQSSTSEPQPTSASSTTIQPQPQPQPQNIRTKKPVVTIPLFSLYTTNVFSCRIPITDVYSPKEHWQWSATLWRGIIGPDLTIYLRDVDAEDMSRPVEHSEVERLFVVKRGRDADGSSESSVANVAGITGIESATLRRVGFEVSEWIRAFGGEKKA